MLEYRSVVGRVRLRPNRGFDGASPDFIRDLPIVSSRK